MSVVQIFKNISEIGIFIFSLLWQCLLKYCSILHKNTLYNLPTSKANSNNNKFSPERPLKVSLLNLVSCSLYQDVEAPDDAGDGHQVEGDAAAELPSLQRTHVQLLPLSERFYLDNFLIIK